MVWGVRQWRASSGHYLEGTADVGQRHARHAVGVAVMHECCQHDVHQCAAARLDSSARHQLARRCRFNVTAELREVLLLLLRRRVRRRLRGRDASTPVGGRWHGQQRPLLRRHVAKRRQACRGHVFRVDGFVALVEHEAVHGRRERRRVPRPACPPHITSCPPASGTVVAAGTAASAIPVYRELSVAPRSNSLKVTSGLGISRPQLVAVTCSAVRASRRDARFNTTMN